jgi:hypothetical protein
LDGDAFGLEEEDILLPGVDITIGLAGQGGNGPAYIVDVLARIAGRKGRGDHGDGQREGQLHVDALQCVTQDEVARKESALGALGFSVFAGSRDISLANL